MGQLKTSNIESRNQERGWGRKRSVRAAGAGRDHIPLLHMSRSLPNSPHGHVHEEITRKKYNPQANLFPCDYTINLCT